jgi:hypothetical protein
MDTVIIYQRSELEYQAFDEENREICTGDLAKCQQRFPAAEVFTCASLGADECTIGSGESCCRICED